MKENLLKIFHLIAEDETLLRLLYYQDNPLDPSKPNILEMPDVEKNEIINDKIKTTPKTYDMDSNINCRLLLYPGDRKSTNSYYVTNQQLNVDVYAHFSIDENDMRLSWICDIVNDLIYNKHVAGAGKTVFFAGGQIETPPSGYAGYRLIYSYGST